MSLTDFHRTDKNIICKSSFRMSADVELMSNYLLDQCDQIGRNFATWAVLGYFLLNQFLPKQAVSTRDLL
jgi:hypothetical protein